MIMKFSKGAETRRRIIDAAIELFHRQGIYATSPDEVIEASGTGKGQFYYHFKNKKDLIHAIFQLHMEAIRDGTGPVNYDIDSWPALERCFQAHVELQKNFGMARSCFFGTIGNELASDDELVRQDINLIFEIIRNKLAHFFSIERTKGRLREGAKPMEMADFCIAAIQGAMLMGKIKRDSGVVQTALGEAFIHVRGYASICSEDGPHEANAAKDGLFKVLNWSPQT